MCLDKATFPVWLSLSYVFYMLKWQISNHYQKGQSKSVKAHIWGFQWLLIRAPACLKMPGSHCIYITDELWDCTINITLWWMMLVARKQIEFTSVFSRCSRGGQKKKLIFHLVSSSTIKKQSDGHQKGGIDWSCKLMDKNQS